MNKDFEKLPEIAARIKKHSMFFDENKNQYVSVGWASDTQKVADINFVGGAWLVYQEQQKRIEDILEFVKKLQNSENLDLQCAGDDIKELLK